VDLARDGSSVLGNIRDVSVLSQGCRQRGGGPLLRFEANKQRSCFLWPTWFCFWLVPSASWRFAYPPLGAKFHDGNFQETHSEVKPWRAWPYKQAMGRLFQFLWKVGLLLSDDPRSAGYDWTILPSEWRNIIQFRTPDSKHIFRHLYSMAIKMPFHNMSELRAKWRQHWLITWFKWGQLNNQNMQCSLLLSRMHIS
jgi:hypothetical protein